MNFNKKLAVAVSGAVLLMAGQFALADSTTDIVDALVSKGVLTEEEGKLISKGHDSKKKADGTVAFKNGFKINSGDGKSNFSVNGRVMADYRYFETGDGNSASNGALIGPDTANTFDIRRAYLGVKGNFGGFVNFEATGDFAGSNTLKYFWVEPVLSEKFKVRFGLFKMPGSLEQLTSSRFIDFTERDWVAAMAPAVNKGIMVHGVPTTGMTYALSVSNGGYLADAGGGTTLETSNSQDGKALNGRLTLNLAEFAGNKEAIGHVGGWFGYDENLPSMAAGAARFRTNARGTQFFSNNVATTALLYTNPDIVRGGLEGIAASGPVKIQGEFATMKFKQECAVMVLEKAKMWLKGLHRSQSYEIDDDIINSAMAEPDYEFFAWMHRLLQRTLSWKPREEELRRLEFNKLPKMFKVKYGKSDPPIAVCDSLLRTSRAVDGVLSPKHQKLLLAFLLTESKFRIRSNLDHGDCSEYVTHLRSLIESFEDKLDVNVDAGEVFRDVVQDDTAVASCGALRRQLYGARHSMEVKCLDRVASTTLSQYRVQFSAAATITRRLSCISSDRELQTVDDNYRVGHAVASESATHETGGTNSGPVLPPPSSSQAATKFAESPRACSELQRSPASPRRSASEPQSQQQLRNIGHSLAKISNHMTNAPSIPQNHSRGAGLASVLSSSSQPASPRQVAASQPGTTSPRALPEVHGGSASAGSQHRSRSVAKQGSSRSSGHIELEEVVVHSAAPATLTRTQLAGTGVFGGLVRAPAVITEQAVASQRHDFANATSKIVHNTAPAPARTEMQPLDQINAPSIPQNQSRGAGLASVPSSSSQPASPRQVAASQPGTTSPRALPEVHGGSASAGSQHRSRSVAKQGSSRSSGHTLGCAEKQQLETAATDNFEHIIEKWDAKSGRPYWLDLSAGVTSWTPPDGWNTVPVTITSTTASHSTAAVRASDAKVGTTKKTTVAPLAAGLARSRKPAGNTVSADSVARVRDGSPSTP